MISDFQLRPICDSDHYVLREVYVDAINYQKNALYTQDQIQAWSALAWLPGILDRSFFDVRKADI